MIDSRDIELAHFTLNEKGEIFSPCRAFEKAFGSIANKTLFDFLVSETQDSFAKKIKAIQSFEGKTMFRLLSASGEILSCTPDLFPASSQVTSSNEKKHKFICFVSKAHNQNEQLYNEIGFPVVSCDYDGNVKSFNKFFGQLLGDAKEGFISKNFINSITGLEGNIIKEQLVQSLFNSGAWSGGIRFAGGLGTNKLFLAKAVRVQKSNLDAGHVVFSLVESAPEVAENKEAPKITYEGYDYLTGLPTRPIFFEALQKTISRHKRTGSKDALLLIDLDHFKEINDTYGHNVGDEVLRVTANRLGSALRDSDVVARLGGDEFGFILYDYTDLDALSHIVEKIRSIINEPITYHEHTFSTSASIGVVSDFNDDSIDKIMEKADLSSYFAKSRGRNIFQFFNRELGEELNKRKTIRKRLAYAIIENKLSLDYQPRIDITARKVTAIEAFLRWNDDLLGAVPPLDFIHIAEEDGLAGSMTKWVIDKAIQNFKEWQHNFDANTRLSLNISLRQLLTSGFADSVLDGLKKEGLSGQQLELEISEETLMVGGVRISSTLNKLKKEGIRIILDNYGTSYSSTALFLEMGVDAVKFDRTLISKLDERKGQQQLEAMYSFCQKLGMGMIADGVENEATFKYLQKIGCDNFQGFYFCPPIHSEDCVKRLSNLIDSQFSKGKINFPIL